MLGLIWKFILGVIIGFTARFLLPGAEHMGFWLTGILGVVGSFGGHFLASAMGLESGKKPSGRLFSALISVGGAVLLLIVVRALRH